MCITLPYRECINFCILSLFSYLVDSRLPQKRKFSSDQEWIEGDGGADVASVNLSLAYLSMFYSRIPKI